VTLVEPATAPLASPPLGFTREILVESKQ